MSEDIVKRGLVLEGGAMRGMFTAGVMDVFMENDIRFDGAAGISAGAIFGCNYKSHQIGRVIRYNTRFSRDPRYSSIRTLIRTGDLYGAEFCYRDIPDILDVFDRETFKNDPMEFYVGATDVETGKIEFHKCIDGESEDIQWMRASASMPIVSRPVRINGREYLDGGITDSVPYEYLESLGYNRNVIVLTQPLGFVKKDRHTKLLMKLLLHKYPNIASAMADRHIMYNRQMEEIRRREQDGRSLVIRPATSLGIGRTEKDPDELQRVYREGRKEAERRLPEVIDFLL